MYKELIRPILFKFDAEKIHDITINTGNKLSNCSLIKYLAEKFYCYENEKLNLRLLKINFKNPVGLAAGFDKNALLTQFMPCFGFGFMEVGSITAEKCTGNPKPRLFRLAKDESLLVRYGLKNEGAIKVSRYLKDKKFKIPLGISIAKTNNTKIFGDNAIDDYCKSFRLFRNIGSYTTINISCPNASDGTTFCEDNFALKKLLIKIKKIESIKPILLKISPDINSEQLSNIIDLSKKYKISGIIISNLTKKRNMLKTDKNLINAYGYGGISGKPLQEISNKLIKEAYNLSNGNLIIIGCGGIFNAQDAYKKLKLGSSLLQLITCMIYEGPNVINRINKGLVSLMKKEKFNNINEAIGYDLK